MKQAITIFKYILLGIPYLYLFFADRITLFVCPFIKNQWHANLATNNDTAWVFLLTFYRVVTFLCFFTIYSILRYVL